MPKPTETSWPNETQIQRLLSPTANAQEAFANWTLVLSKFAERKTTDHWNLAALLATVIVETAGTIKPIKEFGGDEYFANMYWGNEHVRLALGNKSRADAILFHGRGFIQLTGRNNYTAMGVHLGLPLTTNPDLMLQPAHSADALVAFWLGDMQGKSGHTSWPAAWANQLPVADIHKRARALANIRQVVNGGHNGLAEFMTYFDYLLPV